MVTLITEQLRKQSLEEPYDKASNVHVPHLLQPGAEPRLAAAVELSVGARWAPTGACSASVATPSSCCSSPTPLLQRRFSLSPVHIQDSCAVLRVPRPSPSAALACGGMEHPALSPSPTSACSTPSSCRRGLHPALPRCHSQPCDMRRPRLKRRHDPDLLPCQRPGLDFSKMTQ
ncbi:unnamed protein product, partial [Tetraodon nigroviridis]